MDRIIGGAGCTAVIVSVMAGGLLLLGDWYLAAIMGPIALGLILITALLIWFTTPKDDRAAFMYSLRRFSFRRFDVAGLLGGLAALIWVIASLPLAWGAWQLITNLNGISYDGAAKSYAAATVVGTSQMYKQCDVALTIDRRKADASLTGDCGSYAVLQPGDGVRVEEWNGKVTWVYAEQANWPTLDNPGPNLANALSLLGVAAGLGVAAAAIWGISLAARRIQNRLRGQRGVDVGGFKVYPTRQDLATFAAAGSSPAVPPTPEPAVHTPNAGEPEREPDDLSVYPPP
jgi:hypothetical protein